MYGWTASRMTLNSFSFFEYFLTFVPLNLDPRSFIERLRDLKSKQLKLSQSMKHRHDTCYYSFSASKANSKGFGLFWSFFFFC